MRTDALLLSTAILTALACLPRTSVAGPEPMVIADDAPAPQEAEDLYLQVTLNQVDTGRVGRFTRMEGRLRASVATLRTLGFALLGKAASDFVALDDLPGVAVDFDGPLQRISLQSPLELLSLDPTRLNMSVDAGTHAITTPGALLNYDLYGSSEAGASNLIATTELRAFGIGPGVLSNGVVARLHRDDRAGWRGESVRLDTRWQLSFPESGISVSLGDTVSGNLDWSRPLRMGGVRIGSDFGLQPYRVLTPLPMFAGEAAVPSAVDLYINGLRQFSGQVQPGPFQLGASPGVTGSGNARIVLTDTFGRTRTLDFPFYSTQDLLAKGLTDWSITGGVARTDFGTRSFSYEGDPLITASLRHGVSDAFTIESQTEAGGGVVVVGAGGRWLLGAAGVASSSYLASRRGPLQGHQSRMAYSWSNGRFNFSIDRQRSRGDYRDVASLYGSSTATVSERVLAGFAVPSLGNVSANYVRHGYPGEPENRYAGLFWSQSFAGRWSANLSFNQNLDNHQDRTSYLSVSVALDRDRRASASIQRTRDRDDVVADVMRPLLLESDGKGRGWRLQGRSGTSSGGVLAEASWMNPSGRYGAGISRYDGADFGYASAAGSVVAMGGRLFAARDINDGFAVVNTGGIAGIPVLLENRRIGVSDADGRLLVTPLRSWQRNLISIDPSGLPANIKIDQVDHTATPRDRSGIEVRFGIAAVKAAVIVLHDRSGQPLALGSEVRVNWGHEPAAVVGYDGETYLDGLHAHDRLEASTPDGVCHATVKYPQTANDPIPRIGPVTCLIEPAP